MTNNEQQQILRGRLDHIEGIELIHHTRTLQAIELRNRHGIGRVLLQGAQLLEWIPVRQKPVIWISPNAKFKAGKSPRGGIPICWPWFGPHKTSPSLPAHGFARTAPWELAEVLHLKNDSHQLTFNLIQEPSSLHFWPHTTPLTLTFVLGESIEMELRSLNNSSRPITISEALHSYFQVGDVREVRIHGLDGCEYLDKVQQEKRRKQAGDITFSGETDRIYLNTTATCSIVDSVLNRCITIEKQGSLSTVVWNPWAEKAAKLGDFPESGHLNMVCVESGNAADNQIALPPGEEHRLWVRYSWTNTS